MSVEHEQVRALFNRAIEQYAPEQWPGFLDGACEGNAALRQRVEKLLLAHQGDDSFLDRGEPAGQRHPLREDALDAHVAATLAPSAAADASFALGNHGLDRSRSQGSQPTRSLTQEYDGNAHADVVIAGRYTLLEKIGEGGMGEVWVAKQTEPVKRKVALKLIKLGMDSRAVLQRFEQERQALALMDHPNIARVLDGGMTSVPAPHGDAGSVGRLTGVSSLPFFVMELVNGLPLIKFCDEAKLTPRERLQLFVPICQAVQHAHQKGIVHRDLKPANILVTMIDGRPVPKVIDFGVAKATGGKLTDETMATGFGAVVGTLEYMSPEQAGFSGEDIDTRRRLFARRDSVRIVDGTAAYRHASSQESSTHRNAARHPRRGTFQAEHATLHGCLVALAGRLAPDRPAQVDDHATGRTGLGRDEMPGETARTALRDGERAGPRRRAWFRR